MKTFKPLFFLFLCLILVSAKTEKVQAASEFNPNRILEDNVLLNTGSMSAYDIQKFLEEKGSFLANYTISNAYGTSKSAAEIIWDAANNNYDCGGVVLGENPTEAERMIKCKKITTVNPQFLLVLLQKEQSLIQNASPSQKALDEATGYGCPTGQSCNPYWKGFGKQVNSAALQFLAYINNPERYGFKNGATYIAKDKYSMLKTPAQAILDGTYNSIVASPGFVSITIENKATAALYNYTPHIYNGNFNTHRLMESYFPNTNSIIPSTPTRYRNFPNGSLLKDPNKPEIWLIENGQKRHFSNWSTFASRFRLEQVISATQAEIDRYQTGSPIKFPEYSLVKTPENKIYLLVGKEKRPFANESVFKNFGFHPDEVESANENDLSSYTIGQTITATSTYLTGTLMQDNKTNEYFYIENGTKALIDKLIIDIKYPGQVIIKKSTAELNAFKTVSPIVFADGTLTRTNMHPTVYLISDGKKRPFASDAVMESYGYKAENVIVATSQLLYNYPMGEIIQ